MLVDTSVWIDHLRRGNARLSDHLHRGRVLVHPFVVGELACGTLSRREETLALLAALPEVPVADHHEVLALVEARDLAGRGIGWVDTHLLAGSLLARTGFWTLDRRLLEIAREMGIADRP